ncbi:MAG: sugar transferase, partial [Oscillospiraceae bacterium]
MIKKIGLIFKHIFDFVAALILSTIALPVLLIAVIVIKIISPEDSPIFKQVRVGYKNKPFTI